MQSITTEARLIASSEVNSAFNPILLKPSILSSFVDNLAPLFNKFETFDLSVVNGVYLLNVTSSIPKSSLKLHSKPIKGSPIVPVPITCTIRLDIFSPLFFYHIIFNTIN